MLKLHTLENTELTAYCLSILEKHGIKLIRDFFAEKPEKLMKILNLNFEQIKHIKKEFRRLHGTKPIRYDKLLDLEKKQRKFYGTYITELDNMLAPSLLLNAKSFWEICGPTGVGKTQLALTIMLNFVIEQYQQVLFIDTKLDFSASRIKNMLKARKIEAEQHAGIMSFIKVERVHSAQGVVEMLEEFHKQLLEGNENVGAIKLIIIDSLPAAWFLLKADSNRLAGKWLLSRLNQNIHRLVCEHFIAVICINLSLLPNPEENESKTKDTLPTTAHLNDHDVSDLIDDDDMETDVDKSHLEYRPALGYFWISKPQLRLSLEYPDENNVYYQDDPDVRVLKLIKSTLLPNDIYCMVKIQPEGVI
ncbi:rad51 recombinase D [Cochliomyia hominivorax]